MLGLSDFVGMPARSWQFGELQQALQRGPLVLAGTSYRDPDVRDWVYELTRDGAPFPVVALLARAGMGLSRDRFTAVNDALEKQWAAVGVAPILLHDHADAAQSAVSVRPTGRPRRHATRRRTRWAAPQTRSGPLPR